MNSAEHALKVPGAPIGKRKTEGARTGWQFIYKTRGDLPYAAANVDGRSVAAWAKINGAWNWKQLTADLASVEALEREMLSRGHPVEGNAESERKHPIIAHDGNFWVLCRLLGGVLPFSFDANAPLIQGYVAMLAPSKEALSEAIEKELVHRVVVGAIRGHDVGVLVPDYILTALGAIKTKDQGYIFDKYHVCRTGCSHEHKWGPEIKSGHSVLFHDPKLYLAQDQELFLSSMRKKGIDIIDLLGFRKESLPVAGTDSKTPSYNATTSTSTNKQEQTTMAANDNTLPSAEIPSTFGVTKEAYKRAAVGKMITDAEVRILKLVKEKLRSIPGGENLPDHPIYDRMILTIIPMAAREMAARSPERLPVEIRTWGVWAADCTIQFQAVKNIDELGDALSAIADDTFDLFVGLGRMAAGKGLLADIGGMYEETVREKAHTGQRSA